MAVLYYELFKAQKRRLLHESAYFLSPEVYRKGLSIGAGRRYIRYYLGNPPSGNEPLTIYTKLSGVQFGHGPN